MDNNIGDSIKDIISDAVSGENYELLSSKISKTTKMALDEVKKSLKNIIGTEKNVYKNEIFDKPVPVNKNVIRSAKVKCTLALAFGIVGISLFVLLMSAFTIVGIAIGLNGFFIGTGVCAVLSIGSILFLRNGMRGLDSLKRIKEYIRLFKNRSYYSVEDISKILSSQKSVIVKDLEKCIQEGIFPEGHFDDGKTEFIGTDEMYELYLSAKQDMIEREKTYASAEMREVREALLQGREFVSNIRKSNYAIEGEEVSRKLDLMEKTVTEIFERVEEKPSLLSDIRKFIQYYLPTTEKLIKAYEDFDAQDVQTESIKNSKLEIEKTLDTINEAFYNLYNSLYDDDIIDIKSDISVLRTMFEQEGLTGGNFKDEKSYNK